MTINEFIDELSNLKGKYRELAQKWVNNEHIDTGWCCSCPIKMVYFQRANLDTDEGTMRKTSYEKAARFLDIRELDVRRIIDAADYMGEDSLRKAMIKALA